MSVRTIFRQSLITKKRFKNVGRIIGVVLFVALMFTNIKVALSDSSEFTNEFISLFGIEAALLDATYAKGIEYGHYETRSYNCFEDGELGLKCWYDCMAGDPPECTKGGWGYL